MAARSLARVWRGAGRASAGGGCVGFFCLFFVTFPSWPECLSPEDSRKHAQPIVTQAPGKCLLRMLCVNRKHPKPGRGVGGLGTAGVQRGARVAGGRQGSGRGMHWWWLGTAGVRRGHALRGAGIATTLSHPRSSHWGSCWTLGPVPSSRGGVGRHRSWRWVLLPLVATPLLVLRLGLGAGSALRGWGLWVQPGSRPLLPSLLPSGQAFSCLSLPFLGGAANQQQLRAPQGGRWADGALQLGAVAAVDAPPSDRGYWLHPCTPPLEASGP